MPDDSKLLPSSLLKLLAVVLAAALVGAGIGIAFAKLTDSEEASTPVAPVASERATSTATIVTQTTAAPSARRAVPSVRVLLARLGPPSPATGRALVAVRVRVTNGDSRPLTMRSPVLLAGADEVALAPAARPAAAALLRPLPAGADATGVLRFSTPPAVAQRLTAAPSARLRIAARTVQLKLKTDADFAAP